MSLALLWLAGAAQLHAALPFLPQPHEPPDNASSPAKVALGERLFNEPRLSVTGRYSCASCHQPERHFTDARPVAVGATGELHTLNTPSLYNVAYMASLGWGDAGITTLEAQHRVPLTNRTPLEMGFSAERLDDLRADPDYPTAFADAFDSAPDSAPDGGAMTELNLRKALASYVRSLRAPVSAFDRYLYFDQTDALSADARAGLALFFSERTGCATCHASFNLSGPVVHTVARAAPVFHVTAVGGTRTPFRAPGLRAVSHTAPYMHDGSVKTLKDVVRHYETVRVERVPRFTLTDEERDQLVAFLRTL